MSSVTLARSEVVANNDDRFPLRTSLTLDDPRRSRELVGELSRNLKVLNQALGVRINLRGDQLTISGTEDRIAQAIRIVEQLYELVAHGHPLHAADVDQAARLLRREPDVRLLELYSDTIAATSKKRIHPRSPRQREYIQAMRDRALVFGVGPAGTGKTYLAMAMAVSHLFRDEVKRIILCRPAVEAGEKLGFLPGDLVAKVNPYLRPLYDALFDLVGFDRATRLIEKNVIEVAPLAFMRGRTLSSAFVILDEAQNTTREQMKMFLTRIGIDSRVVVTGDVTQVDLPRGKRSGLADALRILRGLRDMKVVHLTDADVVRHPLVSAIVRAYARDQKAPTSAPRARHRDDGPTAEE
ncbi:MAG: PhoH family protein [Myxococcota bacterium]